MFSKEIQESIDLMRKAGYTNSEIEEELEISLSPVEPKVVTPKTQTLTCEVGKHEWTREAKRGRKPPNCPEHTVEVAPSITPEHQAKMIDGRKRKSSDDRQAKIKEILDRNPACRCEIYPDITDEELRAMAEHTCCDPDFICPTWDSIRRVVYHEPTYAYAD